MSGEYRRIIQLSVVAIALSSYSLYAFGQLYPRPEIKLENVEAPRGLAQASIGAAEVIAHETYTSSTKNPAQNLALHTGLETFYNEPVNLDTEKSPVFETVAKAEHQAEFLRKIAVHTKIAVAAIEAATAQAGGDIINLQLEADSPLAPFTLPYVTLEVPKQRMATGEAHDLQGIAPISAQSATPIIEFTTFEDSNIPVAVQHQMPQRSAHSLEASAAPFVTLRPVTRPNSIAALVPRPAMTSSLRSTTLEPATPTAAVAPLTKYARQGRLDQPPTAGVIIGVFETPDGRWTLIESSRGKILILQEGDRVGNSIISEISNGHVILNDAGREVFLGIGDTL